MSTRDWQVGDIAEATNPETGETFPVIYIKVGLGKTWLSPHGKHVERQHELTRTGALKAPSIPEPQGLGAVVRVGNEHLVRAFAKAPCPWQDRLGHVHNWSSILCLGELEILSQGAPA